MRYSVALICLICCSLNATHSKKLLRELYAAVVENDSTTVRRILHKNPSLATRNFSKKIVPFLHHATVNGNIEIIENLLIAGASLKSVKADGSTPLHVATNLGNETLVQFYLDIGANPESADNAGLTPLHIAAIQNNISLIHVLMQYNPHIDKTDSEGNTPLMKAIQNNSYDAIAYLLGLGASCHVHNKLGETPLHYAVISGNVSIVQALLDTGCADVDARTKYSATPLMFAAHRNHERIISCLLNHNADVDAQNVSGITALMATVTQKRGLHSLILNQHPNVALEDAQKKTAFEWAILRDNMDALIALLDYDSRYHYLSNEQKNKLFYFSAQLGKKNVLQLLCCYGISCHDEKIISDLIKIFTDNVLGKNRFIYNFPIMIPSLAVVIHHLLSEGASIHGPTIVHALHATIRQTPLIQYTNHFYALIKLLYFWGLPAESQIPLMSNVFRHEVYRAILANDEEKLAEIFPTSPSIENLRETRILYKSLLSTAVLLTIGQKKINILRRLLLYADPNSSFNFYSIPIKPYDLLLGFLKHKNENKDVIKQLMHIYAARIRLDLNVLIKLFKSKLPDDVICEIFRIIHQYPPQLMTSVEQQDSDNATILGLLNLSSISS